MLLSFELFPPKTDKGMENLPGTIEHLCEYKPEYTSCTYGAGGTNVGKNMDVCKMIQAAGTTPVTHFTCIETQQTILNQAATINMALSRNGCVMPRELCKIISKN